MSVNNKAVSSIALPYARALFDVLLDPNKANEDNIDMICLQILSNLSQVVMSPEFYVLISNPKITKDQLLTILVEFVSKFISKNTNNILVETITKLLKLLKFRPSGPDWKYIFKLIGNSNIVIKPSVITNVEPRKAIKLIWLKLSDVRKSCIISNRMTNVIS